MRLADYHAIQEYRERMLAAVQQEVEAYLNTPGLYVEGVEDDFPNRSRMTGDYYLADESYRAHVGPVWFQIGIMCRCLEQPRREGEVDLDYLGLEVCLQCDPTEWSFTVFRNTHASII